MEFYYTFVRFHYFLSLPLPLYPPSSSPSCFHFLHFSFDFPHFCSLFSHVIKLANLFTKFYLLQIITVRRHFGISLFIGHWCDPPVTCTLSVTVLQLVAISEKKRKEIQCPHFKALWIPRYQHQLKSSTKFIPYFVCVILLHSNFCYFYWPFIFLNKTTRMIHLFWNIIENIPPFALKCKKKKKHQNFSSKPIHI